MRCKLVLVLVLLLSFCTVSAYAQFKASIQGTVMDPNTGAVSEARVTLTNQETGVSRHTLTSDQGFYRISELPPGRYTLIVEATGFKSSMSKDVEVKAEEPRGFDVTLEVGAVNEQVTVSASAESLHTENANTGNTITTDQIARLPQFGRDPYELLRLTPGVFGDGSRSGNGQSNNLPNDSGKGGSIQSVFQIENEVQVVANGQRTASNNFTIDGVSVNSLGYGGNAVLTPSQDSIQEITILSNSYSAEDGRGSGAQVKVVSKGGTNQPHGAGFFNYEDPNWNAFNKYGGPGSPPIRVNNNYRQFGASLGGPILKEKLFFFFSYEGLRSHNVDTSAGAWVETSDFRQRVINSRPGSVTAAILSSPGVAPRVQTVLNATCADAGITDPTQCQVVPGGLDIGSLTGATGTYVDPFAGGGLDGNPDIQFVTLALPSTLSGDQYNGRLDYDLGRNHFAFSSYFTFLNKVNPDTGGRSRLQQDVSLQPLNQTEAFSFIRTFSPTLVNEFRVNFTRFHFNQISSNTNVNFGIPRIEIEGYSFDRIRFGADRSEATPAVFAENSFNFRDKLTKNIGTHALSIGADVSAEQDNNNLLGGARPLYSNVHLWNFANDTPVFEAINANPQTGGPADAQRYFRSKAYGFFLQDDWKVKPNLTLNFGLRYEYFSPLADAKNRLSNLVLGPGGSLSSSRVVHTDRLFNPDKNNFGPRLGFAWSPGRFHGNSVLRGGFGLAYNRPDDVLFSNSRANPPGYARFNLCCGTSGSPFDGGAIVYELGSNNSATSFAANPALAFGIDPVTGGVCADVACTADQGVEIYGGYPNYRDSYVYIYSLEIEHRLRWGLIATTGYQGSAGHKLTRLVNQNFLQVPSNSWFAVYFPTSDVNSNYNALNLRLRKQMSHGLLFDTNYRYSKSIDQLSNEGPGAQTNQTDPAHPQTEHGPSDFDATHNFNFTTLWDVPFFRDRSRWSGKLLGGWEINGIVTAHSGFPWTPVTGFLSSVPVTGAATINPTRPTGVLAASHHDYSNDTFTTTGGNFPGGGLLYFSTNQTTPPSLGPGVGRNSQRGPHYLGIDMSVVKNFKLPSLKFLGERAGINLRGNFYNIFNKLNLQPLEFASDETRIENTKFGMSPGGTAGRVIEFEARFSF